MTYRDTSRAAYATASVGANEARVLAYVQRARDGMTCDEFIAATGVPHQSASPAFTTLEQRGLLLRTSRKRATRTGAMAAVYVTSEPGTLFSSPKRAKADTYRAIVRAAFKARTTGDWGDFDAAVGELPTRERERLQ